MSVPPAPINFSSLNDLRDLSGNGQSPVFAIKLGTSMYVVKRELGELGVAHQTKRSAIDGVYGIAQKAAGGASGRGMSQAELTSLLNASSRLGQAQRPAIDAFKRAYEDTKRVAQQPRPGQPPPLPPRPATGPGARVAPPMPKGAPPSPFDLGKWNVKPSAQEDTSWVIMEHVQGMLDLKHIVASANKSDAARAHMALFEDENLRRLGRIIVTDIFIGNNDRFEFGDDSLTLAIPCNPEGNPYCLPNPGNIIFVDTAGKLVLSGMDPLDPNGRFELETNGNASDELGRGMYYGAKLKDGVWRALAAEVLLKAISGVLERKLLGGAFDPKYYKPEHVNKVVEGMGQGLQKLMQLCEQMLRTGRPPADLVSRMEIVGWKTAERPRFVLGGHRQPPPLPPRPGAR